MTDYIIYRCSKCRDTFGKTMLHHSTSIIGDSSCICPECDNNLFEIHVIDLEEVKDD